VPAAADFFPSAPSATAIGYPSDSAITVNPAAMGRRPNLFRITWTNRNNLDRRDRLFSVICPTKLTVRVAA
jgi:hypothetical protein